MKFNYLRILLTIVIACLLTSFATGCASSLAHWASPPAPTLPAPNIYTPAQAKALATLTAGGFLTPETPITRTDNPTITKTVKVASPAHSAIQKTFNWLAVASVIGGLAAIALGAFSIYGGQILAGIKLIIGGIMLPVCGVFFAYHWGVIVSLVLIAAGVYLLITYWTSVKPLLAKLEADAEDAAQLLEAHFASLKAHLAPVVAVAVPVAAAAAALTAVGTATGSATGIAGAPPNPNLGGSVAK